jgi:histone-arginine methyltransferase CARM1
MTSRKPFGPVSICRFDTGNSATADVIPIESGQQFSVFLSPDNSSVRLEKINDGTELMSFRISDYKALSITDDLIVFRNIQPLDKENNSFAFRFMSSQQAKDFDMSFSLAQMTKPAQPPMEQSNEKSEFDTRTEEASARQYFQFYGYLFQQQNMLQDYTRTCTYQRAIHNNIKDFKDKIVLDVGAGSGILSFFAVQAGAKKVYAVEASSMAIHCQELVRTNGLAQKIVVIPGKIEEISLPEKVDIVISEPMGYMLVNERMLESYIHARKFLKPQGKMFPTTADMHFALFSDDALYLEQSQKASFWCQENFYGINLSALKSQAYQETFKQPVVDSWHPGILISRSVRWSFNFEKDPVEKLQNIVVPFELVATRSGFVHGIASWFDVAFQGSENTTWLSTSPTEPLTHWYQIRCLLQVPLMVQKDQTVRGHITMIANEKQSYDVEYEVEVDGIRSSNRIDLKNPHFRYTAQAILPPAGSHGECPSDALMQGVLPDNANLDAMSVEGIPFPQSLSTIISDVPLPPSNAAAAVAQLYNNSALMAKLNGHIPANTFTIPNAPVYNGTNNPMNVIQDGST